MTKDDYKNKLASVLEICNTHHERMMHAISRLDNVLPVKSNNLNCLTPDQVSLSDQMIYRFSQLQDTIDSKLFPLLLLGLGEDISNKPFIDILNKLEKLSIIDNAEKWLSLREIRNLVTHEYPGNEDEVAYGLNKLYQESIYLSSLLEKLVSYVDEKRLID